MPCVCMYACQENRLLREGLREHPQLLQSVLTRSVTLRRAPRLLSTDGAAPIDIAGAGGGACVGAGAGTGAGSDPDSCSPHPLSDGWAWGASGSDATTASTAPSDGSYIKRGVSGEWAGGLDGGGRGGGLDRLAFVSPVGRAPQLGGSAGGAGGGSRGGGKLKSSLSTPLLSDDGNSPWASQAGDGEAEDLFDDCAALAGESVEGESRKVGRFSLRRGVSVDVPTLRKRGGGGGGGAPGNQQGGGGSCCVIS